MADNFKELTLTKDVWTRLDKEFGTNLITVRNIGGTAVSVYITEDTTTITDEYLNGLGIDPIEIGGVAYEISNNTGQRFWAKAVGAAGKISIRIKGTLDPSEDITVVSSALTNLQIAFNEHLEDNTNPHKVTKDQVGLGNLPNAKSDAVDNNNSNVLATSKAVYTVQQNLNTHMEDKTNPHKVTKDQVGLGNVPNFKKATESDAIDSTNDNTFMTPHTTYVAVSKWVEMSMNVAAQTITQGKVGNRITGWSLLDCSSPSLVIEKVSDKSYKVNKGLQVGFADSGKTRISTVSTKEFTINIPAEESSNSVYYTYVELNADGDITAAAHTKNQPNEGMERGSTAGDFFNVARNIVLNINDEPIRRVYIGRVATSAGNITTMIPAPIGSEYVFPVVNTLVLGGRLLIRNPFVAEVNTTAEVEYNGNWGPTYWNDQVGVMATPYPNNPMEQCVIQCGLMGFLACGRESGSPFGVSFEAITTAPRARIRFQKKYK